MDTFGERRRQEEQNKRDEERRKKNDEEEEARRRREEQEEITVHYNRLVRLIMERLAASIRAVVRLSDIMGDQHNDFFSRSYLIELGLRMGQVMQGEGDGDVVSKVLSESSQWKAWLQVQGWLDVQGINCTARPNLCMWDLELVLDEN